MPGSSRGTFYFHYADIYALMEQMESVQLARLESLMDNLIPNISREDVPPALTALFSYMNDNPEVCMPSTAKTGSRTLPATPRS